MSRSRILAALTYFEWGWNHTPVLPARIGKVHALPEWRPHNVTREPDFLDSPGSYRKAICGATVKVVLQVPFKTDEPEGCSACARGLETWRRKMALRDERIPSAGRSRVRLID